MCRAGTDDDASCFWMLYEEWEQPSPPTHGLCECFGHFDLEECAHCAPGWTGDDCDVPAVAVRRDVRALDDAEFLAFKAADGGPSPWGHGAGSTTLARAAIVAKVDIHLCNGWAS